MNAKKNFKLYSLEISNIKNVEYGKIEFSYKDQFLNVVGIYGQNGSGKTTVIECMELVKNLLSGRSLDSDVLDLLEHEKNSKIRVQFFVNQTDIVDYEVCLKKIRIKEEREFEKRQIDKVMIISESLKTKEAKKNARYSSIIEYKKIDDETIVLNPKYRFPMSISNIKKIFSANAKSEEAKTSFIFGKSMYDYMKDMDNLDDKALDIYVLMRKQLPRNLFIYTNRLYGMINAQIVMPFLFAYKSEEGEVLGTIPLDINKKDAVSPDHFRVLQSVVKQINMVLPAIIPGIEVKLLELSRYLDDDGDETISVEFVSVREGKQFPFRCESDGIKKIVSILSSIINLYGFESSIVLIDEFDSGIYEYLLGELIEILDKNAKGQLIFTSHNLRPLEVLNDKEIIFTTVNPQNRYVRSESIKQTNNLRNVYLRKIQVGGGEDKLYNETDSFLIKKNFRQASKSLISVDLLEKENKENG